MIFRRVLIHELVASVLAVFLVLLAITVTTLWIRLLGEAASGALASEAVIAFLGFSVLGYLPVLLSVTLFLSVLLTLNRSYRDSEMVVWFSSGLSLAAWIRPVMFLATPIVFTIAVISLVLSPWALDKSDEYRRQLESRDDLASVAPGVFKESKQADRVFFVENFSGEKNSATNIFMRSEQHQQLGIMVAKHGYQALAGNGDRFMVLLNGRRYEGQAGSPEYKIMDFERYTVRIEPYEAKLGVPTAKSFSTRRLLRERTPVNMAELQWRISLPISALLLALLAIPLSFSNPRSGRSLNLIVALLIYMIYSNFLSIAQAWVAQGKLSPFIGLWAVHGVIMLLLAAAYYHRISLTPLFSFKRR